MNDSIYKPRILCADDDPYWHSVVKDATNTRNGLAVYYSDTFNKTIKRINSMFFDVVLLDSQFNNKSRIHELILNCKKQYADVVSLVALTEYTEDISGEDEKNLFRILDKTELKRKPENLKKVVSDALRRSLSIQASEIEPSKNDNDLIDIAKKLSREKAREPRSKLISFSKISNYLSWIGFTEELSIPQIKLDVIGYVTELDYDQAEVAFIYSENEREHRIFPKKRLAEAGIFEVDDCFRYQIFEWGPDLISHIEKTESPPELFKEGLKQLNDLDTSVFNKFNVGDA